MVANLKLLVLRSFFFNDTATTEIYTLSLHDALPILPRPLRSARPSRRAGTWQQRVEARSEEHTSELQSRRDLVCRLLLEKRTRSGPTSIHWPGTRRNRACPRAAPPRGPGPAHPAAGAGTRRCDATARRSDRAAGRHSGAPPRSVARRSRTAVRSPDGPRRPPVGGASAAAPR